MPIPDEERRSQQGTRKRDRDQKKVNGGKGTPASQPKGGKKKGKQTTSPFDIEALNPPFDPRMRRIGSPLNMTSKIKRGWIQSEDGSKRVNFLYNPPSLSLSHAVSADVPTQAQTDQQSSASDDVTTPSLASTGSSLSVQLLYDRTYELFSAPKGGELGFANTYGVWADVAAWYTFLGMYAEMPTSWEESMIENPPIYTTAYLFMGPKLVYYGYPTGISVTYSHWTQEMVPARCAVDISFEILPDIGKKVYQGQSPMDFGLGWLGDFQLNPDGTVGQQYTDPTKDPNYDPEEE